VLRDAEAHLLAHDLAHALGHFHSRKVGRGVGRQRRALQRGLRQRGLQLGVVARLLVELALQVVDLVAQVRDVRRRNVAGCVARGQERIVDERAGELHVAEQVV
jgi:prophage antirepressor-like protein